mgnify:FL=1|tara:strand:- start:530 stop:889 length:360 start_codon:yes stop_codon:yes gene_type:complete
MPEQIAVLITDRDIEGGIAGKVQAAEEMMLAALISKYLTKLGFQNALASSVVVQLLTHGKVRVDFSTTAERLELRDMRDMMSATDAMTLFDDYAKRLKTADDNANKGKTMRIMVQKPRQ